MPASEPAQSGLIVSPADAPAPYLEAWKIVLSLGDGLDDSRLIAEFGSLSGLTSDQIPIDQTASVEAYADVRRMGAVENTTIRVEEPTLDHIHSRFAALSNTPSKEKSIEIVILRVRRYRKL